nr:putative polyprotein [Tanacetum cinerariifolium]
MTNTQTPPPTTTVVNTIGVRVTNTVANHAERLENFNGQNFKRWQQKMFFYLTTLGLAWFLKETISQVEPPSEGQSSNAHVMQAVEHGNIQTSCFTIIAVDNGHKLYMGNSATADIKGEGDVVLKMTFEKELKLTNVLGYAMNGMFKLNVMVIKNKINKMNSSAYLIESSNVWHDRLGHQNGIAERKNRTLKEMVTAMLISSGMSQDMWGEAILTATYLLSKIPHKEKEETPYELWMGRKPTYQQQDENDLQVERQDQVEEVIKPRRGKRARIKKSFGPDFVYFIVENKPTSYREAVTSLEGHQWKEAIKSEIDSILQNHTWELVDVPPDCIPLGYKWIIKKKMKADGTIDKYKARLVNKRFRQREGLDYFDTYLPVTRITSIRMILAIATLRNLEVHQMDVKTEFLNGDLEEEIYMNQPKGFIYSGQEGKASLSSPAVQQLWTLYPGKQTANMF